MRSVELFAGAGGLAIAMSNAGFRHAAVIERNHDACETFRDVTYLRDASVPAYADSCTNAALWRGLLGRTSATATTFGLSRISLPSCPSK